MINHGSFYPFTNKLAKYFFKMKLGTKFKKVFIGVIFLVQWYIPNSWEALHTILYLLLSSELKPLCDIDSSCTKTN